MKIINDVLNIEKRMSVELAGGTPLLPAEWNPVLVAYGK